MSHSSDVAPGRKRAARISAGALGAFLVSFAGGASAQSSAEEGSIPNLSGYFRHNTSAYSPPALGGPGPVGDLPGFEHQGSDPWVGDHLNPILLEHTAAEVRRLSEFELAGGVNLAGYQLCQLIGVPLVLTQRENVQLLQTPGLVTIIYQRDHQVRHVYLNVPHSESIKPTWYGESVGHYEGDTLVVDTIGQTDKTRVDRYGSFSSEELHVVERYRISDDGRALEVQFTVTDPNHFAMPWNAAQYYNRSDQPWQEVVCAENNRDAITDEEYVGMPVDLTADF